jgi:uncharacterized protein with PIN domain
VKYLLDSNAIIALVMNLDARLVARAGACDEGDMVTSAIAYAEVAHGSTRGKAPAFDQLQAFVDWACAPVQIRDFATDKHRTVDDTPAGGGAGMVLKADVLAAAVDHATAAHPGLPILAMTPRGKPITQARMRELAAGPGVVILCGRFEGFDERLFEARPRSSR